MTAVFHRNAAHRLRQYSGIKFAVLQHFQACRNLRNDRLVDIRFIHLILREHLVEHELNNRVFRYGNILPFHFTDRSSIVRRSGNQAVIAVRHGSHLHIETARFGKTCRQHVRHAAVQITALQRTVAVHCTFKMLQFHRYAFIFKKAFFLRNNERNGVDIRHQPDFQHGITARFFLRIIGALLRI